MVSSSEVANGQNTQSRIILSLVNRRFFNASSPTTQWSSGRSVAVALTSLRHRRVFHIAHDDPSPPSIRWRSATLAAKPRNQHVPQPDQAILLHAADRSAGSDHAQAALLAAAYRAASIVSAACWNHYVGGLPRTCDSLESAMAKKRRVKWKSERISDKRGFRERAVVGRCRLSVVAYPNEAAPFYWRISRGRKTTAIASGSTRTMNAAKITSVQRARVLCGRR